MLNNFVRRNPKEYKNLCSKLLRDYTSNCLGNLYSDKIQHYQIHTLYHIQSLFQVPDDTDWGGGVIRSIEH